MPSILIAYPIDYTSLFLAQKLRVDADNDITLYLDHEMNNVFFSNAVHDLQCMSDEVLQTTYSRVFYYSCCNKLIN